MREECGKGEMGVRTEKMRMEGKRGISQGIYIYGEMGEYLGIYGISLRIYG